MAKTVHFFGENARILCGHPIERPGKIGDYRIVSVHVQNLRLVTCERCKEIYGPYMRGKSEEHKAQAIVNDLALLIRTERFETCQSVLEALRKFTDLAQATIGATEA